MRTKEEFYALVRKLREIAADPQNRACSCPKTECEWHGRCAECVALHRYHRDHFPNCFQQIFNEKIKALTGMGEMDAVEKEKTPAEYWEYVRERDRKGGESRVRLEFKEAGADDLPALLELYNYYIERTTATFDHGPITLEEFKNRLFIGHPRYKTYVVSADGSFIGFCFLSQKWKKAACDATAEIGVYLRPEHTGRGLGRELVARLEAEARRAGFETLVASISGENLQSLRLFRTLGFTECARYRAIGVKFGRKLDVIDFQEIL